VGGGQKYGDSTRIHYLNICVVFIVLSAGQPEFRPTYITPSKCGTQGRGSMTQEKDREGLGDIFERFDLSKWGPFAKEDLVKSLLRWKRGDKWWCEELVWIENEDYDYLYQPSVSTSHWKFCPICGVKRSKEKNDE